jgi:outer membrane protein assembly factor BamB
VKKLFLALCLLPLLAAAVIPQTAPRRYSTPALPAQGALDRLSLTLAWSIRLPTDGSEDGLADVQLLSAGNRLDLLVQTRLGTVLLLDPETGDILWQRHLGQPYDRVQPPAATAENLYLTRQEKLYVLERATGRQRLYTVDPKDGQVAYGYNLKTVPTASPASDDDRIYFPMGDRLAAYDLPRFSATETAQAKEETSPILPKVESPVSRYSPTPSRPASKAEPPPRTSSPQPEWAWGSYTEGYPLGVPVIFPPIIVGNTVNVLGTNGTLICINPDKQFGRVEERYRYSLFGRVAVPMEVHKGVLYMGCEDHSVYALLVESRRLLWRFQAGAAILRKPVVTDRDVFVAATRIGLYRVDRDTGEAIWLNKRAARFLATNEKFVYALDRAGKLLVLDHARGRILADYDLSDYPVPYSNDTTDRIYLGANDGTLLCLHHQSERLPYRSRAGSKPPEKKTPVEKKEGPKTAPEPEKEAPKGQLKKTPKAEAKEVGRLCPEPVPGLMLCKSAVPVQMFGESAAPAGTTGSPPRQRELRGVRRASKECYPLLARRTPCSGSVLAGAADSP